MEEAKEKYGDQIELYDTIGESTALRAAIGVQAELEEQIAATAESYDALGMEYEKTMEYIGNTEALASASAATEELGNSVDEAGGKIAETSGAVQQAFADMGESIRSVVEEQMDIFSEFEKQHAIDGGKIISNMESQVEGMKSWGDNLSSLAERSTEDGERISTGLLEHLVNLGPEGAAYVQAFVNMTDEELKRANELWESSISLPDTIAEQFTDAGARMVEGLSQGVEQGISALGETGANLDAGLAQGIEENVSIVEDAMSVLAQTGMNHLNKGFDINSPSKKTMETGKYLTAGLSQGIITSKPVVLNALQSVTGDTVAAAKRDLSKEVFHTIGLQITEGLAAGIRAGKSSVINAAVEVARAAVTAAKGELGINSPSKVTQALGGYYMDGWVLGIQEKTGVLKDAVRGALADSLLQDAEPVGLQAGLSVSAPVSEGAGQSIGSVQVFFQPQQMTEEELDRAFDYVNERFGFAL